MSKKSIVVFALFLNLGILGITLIKCDILTSYLGYNMLEQAGVNAPRWGSMALFVSAVLIFAQTILSWNGGKS